MWQCNLGRKARQVQSVRREMDRQEGLPFGDLLGLEWVSAIVQEEVETWRDCVYTPLLTLQTFLTQVLSAEQCCLAAVARLLAFLTSQGRKLCSPKTDPYCKARKKLPEGLLRRLVRESGRRLETRRFPERLLGGRRIYLIDGSTLSMPDTKANQRAYPQARTQKPGVGFPIVRIVAVLSFCSGAVLDLAVGRYRGKRTGEPALLRQLWECLEAGSVAVADCCYGSFWSFAMLQQRGVDSVFPLHQLRTCDFRRGRRLGQEDHLVHWPKPVQRPEWMSRKVYHSLPAELELREMRVHIEQPGFRTESLVLVTTLLDPEAVSASELASVYRVRWHAELDLRSIKVTMQIASAAPCGRDRAKSRCGSPEENVQCGRNTSICDVRSDSYDADHRRKFSSPRLASMVRFASDSCVSRPSRMDIAAWCDRRNNSAVSPRSRRDHGRRPADAKRVPTPRRESPPARNSRISQSRCAESGENRPPSGSDSIFQLRRAKSRRLPLGRRPSRPIRQAVAASGPHGIPCGEKSGLGLLPADEKGAVACAELGLWTGGSQKGAASRRKAFVRQARGVADLGSKQAPSQPVFHGSSAVILPRQP